MASHESLTVQMDKILEEVQTDARKAAKDSIQTVAKQSLSRLKSTSPGGGRYAKGWALKKDGDLGTILYNKALPGLTHLLEKSHVVKNQYGQYGRSIPQRHIKPVEEWANNEIVSEIERRL